MVGVGRTFGVDRSRPGEPYWPLLGGYEKRLVLMSSRGDYGYGKGARIGHMNHVEPSIRTAFGYIGVTDLESVAVEYDEFADVRLTRSIDRAEAEFDARVARRLCRSAPSFSHIP